MDEHALPDEHPLKPLEWRMLEMCAYMGGLKVWGGNFVAALRVFAKQHPELSTNSCNLAESDTLKEASDSGR